MSPKARAAVTDGALILRRASWRDRQRPMQTSPLAVARAPSKPHPRSAKGCRVSDPDPAYSGRDNRRLDGQSWQTSSDQAPQTCTAPPSQLKRVAWMRCRAGCCCPRRTEGVGVAPGGPQKPALAPLGGPNTEQGLRRLRPYGSIPAGVLRTDMCSKDRPCRGCRRKALHLDWLRICSFAMIAGTSWCQQGSPGKSPGAAVARAEGGGRAEPRSRKAFDEIGPAWAEVGVARHPTVVRRPSQGITCARIASHHEATSDA